MLKVRYINPKKDYLNMNVSLEEMDCPENQEEWERYAKRYRHDYGITEEESVVHDYKSWKEHMDMEEELAEAQRQMIEDDYDEELDNTEIDPNQLVGVYDEDSDEIVWVPYKEIRR